jgi:uncharacterized protein (TIGR03067 family)
MGNFVFDLKADPTKDPKWMDLSLTQGKKTVTTPGIYTVNEEEFKLCIPVGVYLRPDGFDTTGKQFRVFTTQRLKN